MRKFVRLALVALIATFIQWIPTSAFASCADYPESITPTCVAENLLVAERMRVEYEAEQARRQAQVEAAAAAQRAQQAADEAARAASDALLPPDSCERLVNYSTNACTEKRIAESSAKAAALAAKQQAAQDDAEVALRKSWGIYDPALGNCFEVANSSKPECVAQNLEAEKRRQADYSAKREAANQAALDAAKAQNDSQTAEEIARRIAWGIYDPALGNCYEVENSTKPECVAQNLVAEKFRQADYAKVQEARNAASIKAAADQKAAQAKAEAKLRNEVLAAAKIATAKTTKKSKEITITCIKGKSTKIVTDVAPTCPKGYKKK
jgi:hypothetical protein